MPQRAEVFSACASMKKTRALNACSFAVMTVFSSGISMYAMARLIQGTLHVFDGLFKRPWVGRPQGIFTFSIVLSAVIGSHTFSSAD